MTQRSGLLGALLDFRDSLREWMQANPEAAAKIALWMKEGSAAQESSRSFMELLLPANWMTLRIGVLSRAQELMIDTGICLAWVPGPTVIEALVQAGSKDERDQVLVEHSESILRDIEASTREVTHPQLIELKKGVVGAVAAFDQGLRWPAQAMAAAVISGVLEDHYGFEHFGKARIAFSEEDPSNANIWSSRRVAIQWTIRRAILDRRERPLDGGFSRHLTAHSVSSRQYNDPNALVGLLLAAGSLRELQEMYYVGKSGFAVTPHLGRLATGAPIQATV